MPATGIEISEPFDYLYGGPKGPGDLYILIS